MILAGLAAGAGDQRQMKGVIAGAAVDARVDRGLAGERPTAATGDGREELGPSGAPGRAAPPDLRGVGGRLRRRQPEEREGRELQQGHRGGRSPAGAGTVARREGAEIVDVGHGVASG